MRRLLRKGDVSVSSHHRKGKGNTFEVFVARMIWTAGGSGCARAISITGVEEKGGRSTFAWLDSPSEHEPQVITALHDLDNNPCKTLRSSDHCHSLGYSSRLTTFQSILSAFDFFATQLPSKRRSRSVLASLPKLQHRVKTRPRPQTQARKARLN